MDINRKLSPGELVVVGAIAVIGLIALAYLGDSHNGRRENAIRAMCGTRLVGSFRSMSEYAAEGAFLRRETPSRKPPRLDSASD